MELTTIIPSVVAGIESGLFADVSPNPTDADVAAGRQAFRSGDHDGVVAIGGGSGMDAGKSISLVAANDVDLYCKNDTMLSATVNTEWGDWSDKVQCPSGQAVTGLVTRVEDFQEPPLGDNSALNGVRMMCSAY